MGKKIKNPCKICCLTVTKKTGLQCQGACQKWVHYCCLNYTEGKIQDIKAGIIKITCPCPDCRDVPNEPVIETGYSCSNVCCPSNAPRPCNDAACSANNFVKTHKSRSCESFYERHFNNEQDVRQPRMNNNNCCNDKEVQPSNRIIKVPANLGNGLGNNDDASFATIEQMCQTVGQLTMQMRDLMSKMKQVVDENRRLKSAGQARPKPCFCPNNNQF